MIDGELFFRTVNRLFNKRVYLQDNSKFGPQVNRNQVTVPTGCYFDPLLAKFSLQGMHNTGINFTFAFYVTVSANELRQPR